MKICADLHTHTIASGHAFATLNEMIGQAKKLGYSALAITDHARTMPGSPAKYYFDNLVRQPDILEDGFILLKGVEGNVLDSNGTFDVEEKLLPKFDWIIASIHGVLVQDMTFAEATNAWLHIAQNPYVDMIGHSEQSNFFYDYDRVTKAFAEKNKVVEMNAASAKTRPGNEENQRNLALACKKNGVKIAVNSDAHSTFQMGHFQAIDKMLEEIAFPQERIINTSKNLLLAELRLHKKPIAKRLSVV